MSIKTKVGVTLLAAVSLTLLFSTGAFAENAKAEKKENKVKLVEKKEKADPNKVVAKVGKRKILQAEVDRELSQALGPRMAQIPAAQLDGMRKQILGGLVKVYLLSDAAKASGTTASDKEIAAKIKERQSQLASRGIKVEDKVLKKFVKEDLLITKYLDKNVFDKLSVSDEELRKLYKSFPGKSQPEEVHARHILFKLAKDAPAEKEKEVKAKAEKILAEVKKSPDKFADIAKKSSEGPSAKSGGDLGFFPAKRMVPEFSKAAFALKKGDISGLVRTQFGYHIIKVEDRHKAKTLSFDEVKPTLEKQALQGSKRAALEAHLKTLKGKFPVEILLH